MSYLEATTWPPKTGSVDGLKSCVHEGSGSGTDLPLVEEAPSACLVPHSRAQERKKAQWALCRSRGETIWDLIQKC